MHRFIKNTGIYALGDIIPRLFSFITFPILTNYLVPDEYAVISYVNTINTILLIVTYLCLNSYFLVFYYRTEDERKKNELFGNLSIFVVTINILFAIIFLIFGNHFFYLIGSNVKFFPYIAIAVALNFFNVFSVLPGALFRVQERPLPLTIINILRGLLTMGLTIVFVAGFGFKALGVLISTLIITAIFSVIYIIITLKNMIWNINFSQIKEALIFSLPLVPSSLASYTVSMMDRIFIEKYVNLFDLGIYSVASTIALLLNIASYGTYKALEPYFFKIYKTNYFKVNFIKIFNIYLLFILFCAMMLGVFAREFLYFFAGQDYHGAYFYVPMILVGIVFSAMNMIFGTIITAQGRTKLLSIITIIGGVISCILNITLLQVIGIVAACFASGISFGAIMLLSIYFSGIKMNYINVILAFTISTITVWFLVYYVSIENMYLTIAVKSIIVAIVTIAIMLLMKVDVRTIKGYMSAR